MHHTDFIALDTETGGFHAAECALLSIAAVPSWAAPPFSVHILPVGRIDAQATGALIDSATLGCENYWIGTTVENQAQADERIPQLLSIPAKVRFLICEPLLGSVDLEMLSLPDKCDWCGEPTHFSVFTGDVRCNGSCDGPQLINRIHWVICGGESGGPKARPMHPNWARSLRDQCSAAGVPFFFKQWGDWAPGHNAQLPQHTFEEGLIMTRFGKKKAGRVLDGHVHDEFPKVERSPAA